MAPRYRPHASLWCLPTLVLWLLSRLVLLLNVTWLHHLCDRVFWLYGNDAVLLHQLPYRDFKPEYPPLAVALFMLPGFLPTYQGYATGFSVVMLVADLATLLAVRFAAERLLRWADGWPAALAYTVLAGLSTAVLNKYDVLPGLLSLAAIGALVRRKDTIAWVLLAASILFKGYAIVLAPLFLLYRYRQGGPSWWKGPLAGAACAAIILLPLIAVAGRGLIQSALFHADRGLEIESIYASIVLVAHTIGGLAVSVTPGQAVTSRDVSSGWNAALQIAAPIVLIGGLLITYAVAWRALRRASPPDTLLLLATAAITVFMLAFKALPSHYLLWIIPQAALVVGRPTPRTIGVAIAVVLAVGLGGLIPTAVWDGLRDFNPLAIAIMAGRNLAIVATFVLSLGAAFPIGQPSTVQRQSG